MHHEHAFTSWWLSASLPMPIRRSLWSESSQFTPSGALHNHGGFAVGYVELLEGHGVELQLSISTGMHHLP
jgi:hypothetical protein